MRSYDSMPPKRKIPSRINLSKIRSKFFFQYCVSSLGTVCYDKLDHDNKAQQCAVVGGYYLLEHLQRHC